MASKDSSRETLILALAAVGLGVGAFLYNRRSASAAEVPADRTQPTKALPTPSTVAAAPPAPARSTPSATNSGSGATFSDPGTMAFDAADVASSQTPIEPPTSGPGVPQRALTSTQIIRYKRFLTGMGFTTGRWTGDLNGTLTSAVEAFQRSFNTANQNRISGGQRPMAPVTVTVDGNLGPNTQKALEHFWELEATVEPPFAAVPGATGTTATSGQDTFSAWRGTSTGLDATHDAAGNYVGPLQQPRYSVPGVLEQLLSAQDLLRYKQILKGLRYSPEGLSPTVNSIAWREMILRFQNAYNTENEARAAAGSGRTPFAPLRLETWGLLDPPTQQALEHYVNFIVADYVP